MTLKEPFKKSVALLAGLALGAVSCAASAGNMTTKQLQQQFQKDVVGKTIVYIPISYGLPLTRIWGKTMQKEAKALGMHFKVLDPGFNTQRETQMLESEVHKHPAVLIVHNPNVQVLAHGLRQAEQAGIYTIQVNMASRYKTDAFIGVQPNQLGAKMAKGIVKACSGPKARSHQVALMDGVQTSAFSLGVMQGAQSVFKKHPNIKIVSTQYADWDPQKAHDKAATVLQSHPKLCAYMGWWSGQDQGIAQAVRQAGLKGKVKIFTSGGGEPPACQYVKNGLFYADYSYDAKLQAQQMMAVAKFLLQTHKPAGTFHTAIYSPVTKLTKATLKPDSCTHVGKKGSGS